MLAPANFGSALAKLGKKMIGSILSRMRYFVEPGTGVLEWLELGSRESLALNLEWIHSNPSSLGPERMFAFVITGDYIDRRIETYAIALTQEIGSDGVVRAAAANLNSQHVVIVQMSDVSTGVLKPANAEILYTATSPKVPFLIVPKRSHSKNSMGIMASVRTNSGDENQPTIDAIFRCMAVNSNIDYDDLYEAFEHQTKIVQLEEERVEIVQWIDYLRNRQNKYYIHDRMAMIIFRVFDIEYNPIPVFELQLTAGPEGDANNFPIGFMGREQSNGRKSGVITYYVNYDLIDGCDEVIEDGKVIREAVPSVGQLGLTIFPSPEEGTKFVSYSPIRIMPSEEFLKNVIQKNETTIVDVVFQRLVSAETFEFKQFDGTNEGSFRTKKHVGDFVP
jgi:hypothetical protein